RIVRIEFFGEPIDLVVAAFEKRTLREVEGLVRSARRLRRGNEREDGDDDARGAEGMRFARRPEARPSSLGPVHGNHRNNIMKQVGYPLSSYQLSAVSCQCFTEN